MLSEAMFVDRAVLDNPWWSTGSVAPEYANSTPRQLLSEFYRRIRNEDGPRRATLLMGPRRVGKTWLMHHAIRQLLADGVCDGMAIVFFSLDVPVYHGAGLEELVHAATRITGLSPKTEGNSRKSCDWSCRRMLLMCSRTESSSRVTRWLL